MLMATKKEETKIDEKKKNYIRNYAILGGLFAVCIFFTLYFCRWYEVYKETIRQMHNEISENKNLWDIRNLRYDEKTGY